LFFRDPAGPSPSLIPQPDPGPGIVLRSQPIAATTPRVKRQIAENREPTSLNSYRRLARQRARARMRPLASIHQVEDQSQPVPPRNSGREPIRMCREASFAVVRTRRRGSSRGALGSEMARAPIRKSRRFHHHGSNAAAGHQSRCAQLRNSTRADSHVSRGFHPDGSHAAARASIAARSAQK
jgi:hypothetical protein